MPKKISCGVLTLAAIGASSMLPANDNIIQNGSFDNISKLPADGWSQYYGTKGDVKMEFVSIDGNRVVNLLDNDAGNSIGLQHSLKFTPNSMYTASVKVRSLNKSLNGGAFMQIRLLPSKKIFQIELKDAPLDKFKEYKLVFKVPENIQSGTLYLYSQNPAKAAVQIDDVVIKLAVAGEKTTVVKHKLTPGDARAAKLVLPESCFDLTKLNSVPRPIVFHDPQTFVNARAALADTPHLQKYLAQQQAMCKFVMSISDDELRKLIPAPGSDIVYGLSMNLCPQGDRLRWCGWSDPFKVLGKGNKKYPNAEFKDDNKKFFFTARAHGFIFAELEERVLPALADCYLLTGDKKYAHTAAVLMDAIAPSYCANRRGPLDYPVSASDLDRGGRLQRPYYQTARALMNYVHTFDAILPSGELAAPSVVSGRNMGENIVKDLLWNGAIYCLGHAYDGKQLHNGHADYLRGAAAVGLLLNYRPLTELLFDGAQGFPAMISTSLDRNGFYHESSHGYSQHTISLYQSMADMYESAVRQKWENVESFYKDPVFCNLLNRYADKAEVGGRLPMTGDDGPSRAFEAPDLRVPNRRGHGLDRGFTHQLANMWSLLIRGDAQLRKEAAVFLRNAYKDYELVPPMERSVIFGITQQMLDEIKALPYDENYFETDSDIFGSKGMALIRGGRKEKRHGFQLLFGPSLNHGQEEALSWTFFNHGGEWSYDPGYFNQHYRMGWTTVSVAHQQVTVDGGAVKVVNGGGEITAYNVNTPSGVQFVMAKQDHAFDQTKRFERLLGQADNTESGELEYWLDVSIVDGGRFRDDSFHTLFGKADYNVPMKPTGKFSMYGDAAKGMHFLRNWRLSGYTEKGFYWRMPGNGYGFLLDPACYKSSEAVQAVFSQPMLDNAKRFKNTIKVDFPAENNREYYSVRSMEAPLAPSMAYLIRRDHGKEPSVFAKVMRFQNNGGVDPVREVKSVEVKNSQAQIARAYWVSLSDGRSDLWIVADENSVSEVALEGFPAIRSNGTVTVLRFDSNKTLQYLNAANASEITVGTQTFSGQKNIHGKITAVNDQTLGNISFDVAFDQAPTPHDNVNMVAVTNSFNGALAANWTVRSIEENKVHCRDLRFTFSSCKLTAAQTKGVYFTNPPLAQFFCRGGMFSSALAVGKFIRINGEFAGVIKSARLNGKNVELTIVDQAGKVLEIADNTIVDICEAQVGTSIKILSNINWNK